MNDGGDCRTAQATPGLLKTLPLADPLPAQLYQKAKQYKTPPPPPYLLFNALKVEL